MNVEVQVLCSACEECGMFEIQQEDIHADNKIYCPIRYCEHLKICKNAVEIWEKREKISK